MTGILICDMDGEYRGIARISSIPDYFENSKIGQVLQEFLEDCVDPDTQEIIYRLNNIPKALAVADALESIGCESEVLLCCDADTNIRMTCAEFAGYDVVSETFDDSPLQRSLFDEDVKKHIREDYSDFFTNTDGIILKEYRSNINEFSLFADITPAQEIADYCTWLTDKNNDLFEGARNYAAIKVYIVKKSQY